MSSPRLDALLRLIEAARTARFLRPHTFSHELQAKHWQQQALHGGGFTRFDDSGVVRFEYVVPDHVCRRGHLPLSTLLALVDETTTWASIGMDRHRRPGVSISLEATLEQQVPPPPPFGQAMPRTDRRMSTPQPAGA